MAAFQSPAMPELFGRQASKVLLLSLAVIFTASASASADGPLAAKVKVTPIDSYNGSATLPKPGKIIVYDFAVDPSDVQVDASQKIRPRHLITGGDKPDTVASNALHTFSSELQKKLAKTGLPVEHVAADTAPSDNSLVIQGSFLSLKQGDKTERVVVGMGTGSAQVQSKVDVRLKTAAEALMVAQFQTETTAPKNVGAGVPVAAGLDPAAAAAKATIGDRKKTLDAYATKTADAIAEEVVKAMATQGWVKLDDKGEVIP